VDGPWAMKSEGVGLIVRAISFQDFQSTWSWSTNVTDRQHAIPRPRALHYSASRGSHYDCVITHRTLIQFVTISNSDGVVVRRIFCNLHL